MTASDEYNNWSRRNYVEGQFSKDVRAILARFRAERGWQPGQVWDPHKGIYRDKGFWEEDEPGAVEESTG